MTPPPSPSAEPVPSVADVAAAFQRTLRGESTPSGGRIMERLLDLLHNNLVQWGEEDAARRDVADDAAVARAKRKIDELNAKRHELVEAIDELLHGAIKQTPSAAPTTESPAMVFDRLSVLAIRIHVTDQAANSGDHDRDYAARLPVLHRQLDLMQEALAALFDDVHAGRKRFVPYASLKLYGSERGGQGRARAGDTPRD